MRVASASAGDWQAWQTVKAKIQPLSGKQNLYMRFLKPTRPGARDDLKWFGMVDTDKTTIWAQFDGLNPNNETVEINARRAVFLSFQDGNQLHHRPRFRIGNAGALHMNAAYPAAALERMGLISLLKTIKAHA